MMILDAVITQLNLMSELCGIQFNPHETFIDYARDIFPKRERLIALCSEPVGNCCDKPELTCVWHDPNGKFYRYICFDCRKGILAQYKKKYNKVVAEIELNKKRANLLHFDSR